MPLVTYDTNVFIRHSPAYFPAGFRMSAVDIGRLMEEGAPIDRAVEEAQAITVRRHRQMGLPLVVWREGRVCWVSADEIPLPGEEREQR